ncbi:unnamed protein product [Rotaria socialis]|uniref:RRM domain-containing protein n=1 Tax=Rotaria socialis TaxID=392032 RepID=A0A820YMV6_9BILA|nr:unnamed protein product [Rotaria socialis]CAF4548801.1 unnamed protein product [Rotaria socialis]CAF4722851.1 unnamed protein product [Rotaria socialis]
MSGYGRDSRGAGDQYSSGHSNSDHKSGRGGGDRHTDDQNSGQKRNDSDYNSRGGVGGGRMINGDKKHFIFSAGYGSGSSSSYNRGRNDYQNNNSDNSGGSGGYNRGRTNQYDNSGSTTGGDDNRMETQRDTIFIQNLPKNVTVSQLKDVFSQIGIIKNDKKTNGPKIWIYKDKATGDGKGEATITYEDEEAAQAAINWYHGKEVLSSIVQISLATRRASAFGNRGGSRGSRGGFRSRGKDKMINDFNLIFLILRGAGGDFGGYRGRGGDRGSEYRGSGRGASHGSSRDNRSNPY